MYKWLNTVLCIFAVTPHAGVRIEIFLLIWSFPVVTVTPHAGVRIEIDASGVSVASLSSPPTRGCELK